MREALETALQSSLEANFSGLVSYGEVPDNVMYPYLVWYGIANENPLDSVNFHEQTQIQVDLRGNVRAELMTEAEAVKDALMWQTLSVTGWTNIEIRPILPEVPVTRFGDIWRVIQNYRLWIYRSR